MCEYCVCGPGGGGILQLKKSQSTKIYLNMNFPSGGGILQLKKSQSTKIYLNMNFPMGGGGYSATGKVYVLHLLFYF